jgi:hypothetical protein
MAASVAAQLTSTELADYGNIILNGYATTGPNSTGKLAWQYKETATAPVPLPSVTRVAPTLKGWTTNYMEYYTELPPNAYNQVPGNPTMFDYVVHSFTSGSGPIDTLSWVTPGTGYTPGTYLGVSLTGSSGVGATADIVVEADPDPLLVGFVKSVTLVNPGSGYSANNTLTASLPGGSGFRVLVYTVLPVPGTGNEPRWAQPPRRVWQNQTSAVTPPQYVNNPLANQYSFMYPVADNLVAPPVDTL